MRRDTAPVRTASPGGSVERLGTAPVPPRERSGTPFSHARLWAAASLNPFVIAYGFFVMGFDVPWPWAVCVVLFGCAAGYGLLGSVSAIGPQAGRPTMALSLRVFGRAGNLLPVLTSYLALVGWGAVNLVLAALTAVALTDQLCHRAHEHVRVVCFAVVASAVVTVAVFGDRRLRATQRWIILVSAATVAGYVFLTARLIRLPAHTPAPSCAGIVGALVFVLAAGGLAWVMVGADYSRYLPESSKTRDVRAWTAIGGGLPSAALMLYGVLLCASRPGLAADVGRDPVGALAELAPPWFAAVFLFVTMVGLTSNAAVNLYSSGLSLLAIGAPLRQPVAAAASGSLVLAAAGYAVFVSLRFSSTFESVLDILGIPIAAWCAAFLVAAATTGGRPVPAPTGLAARRAAAVAFASLVGFGFADTADPALRPLVGYLLTDRAEQSAWGAANLGVPIAFALGWALSRVSALRSEGTSGKRTTPATTGPPSDPQTDAARGAR